MDYKKTMETLKKHGFEVSYFDTAEQAAQYMCDSIKGETIGFGGSMTSKEMNLYELLGKDNKVYWHWLNKEDVKKYPEFTVYITSANAIAETGELVNIDGVGNRLASSLYGPRKVYFVCGTNKITPDLQSAMDRARNVATPPNAVRLKRDTPCAKTGRCHDCNVPDRLCRGMVIYMRPMNSHESTEIVLVGEKLGY
jgi:L-lactate utilization protein LutB